MRESSETKYTGMREAETDALRRELKKKNERIAELEKLLGITNVRDFTHRRFATKGSH
jgi:hypothetical protein